jgi:hypothetical protein
MDALPGWILALVLWKGGPIVEAGPFATQEECIEVGNDLLRRRSEWARRNRQPTPKGYVCMQTEDPVRPLHE